MSICAVIPTYNRSKLLAECLDAVFNQTSPVDEVIVVDNVSTDATREMIAERFGKRVMYVRLAENRGGAGGFNVGMKMACERGHKWLWCLDSDAIPLPSTLEREMEAAHARNRKVVAVTCMQHDPRTGHSRPSADGLPQGVILISGSRTTEALPVDCAFLTCLLVNAEAAREVGFLREDLFIYGDDIMFSHALKKVGEVLLAQAAVVLHPHPTAVRETRSGFERCRVDEYWRVYYRVRNGYYIDKDCLNRCRAISRFTATYLRAVMMVLAVDTHKFYRFQLLTRAYIDGLLGKGGKRVNPNDRQDKLRTRSAARSQAQEV